MSGSSGNTTNLNVDNGKRAEDPIANADPNAMIVDQANKDDQIDKETDQQEFSLNVTQFRGTAWAPIEAFSDLKLSISDLKNKLLEQRINFPGLFNVKRGNNNETKSHILAIFNNQLDYQIFLNSQY